MRKIETQMNNAISEGTDWKSANTRVETIDGVSTVFLHDNKIAEISTAAEATALPPAEEEMEPVEAAE